MGLPSVYAQLFKRSFYWISGLFMKNWKLHAAIIASIIAIIMIIGFTTTAIGCWSTWGGSDVEWRVKRFSCQVHTKQHGWIPESKFRTE